MNTINEPSDPGVETQREIIRLALDEIAIEVGTALRDAGIDCPIYLAIPNSGNAIASIATPTDPPDEEWARISSVACGIIGKMLGGIGLRGRELRCAMATATMVAADLTAD